MSTGAKGIKTEENPSVYKKLARKYWRCSLCPANRGENEKNRKKYGRTKPKYKDKRK